MTELEAANARLKATRARCSIQIRGTRAYLVATLPCRDAPGRKQQRIPLGPISVIQAERRAVELAHQLATNTFTWDHWLTPPEDDLITVERFCQAAEALHRTKYARSPERGARTWTKNWLPALRRLPPSGGITERTLLRILEQQPPNSAARRNHGTVLCQVAASLGIPTAALRAASAGYGAAQLTPRDIPEDAVIESVILGMKQRHWRWALGMLATYGLRPHELDDITPGPDKTWIVADATKTGARIVHPCPSLWYDTFKLGEPRRPPASHREMSARVSTPLRAAGAPFTAYGLRHAYAIRLMERGVPAELGARLMGHSLKTHETQYKRWVQQQRIAQAIARYDL